MRHLSVDDELYGRCGNVSILLVAPGDVLQLALGGVEALEGLGQLLAQLGGLFPRLPAAILLLHSALPPEYLSGIQCPDAPLCCCEGSLLCLHAQPKGSDHFS